MLLSGFLVVKKGINWARVCKNAAMVVFWSADHAKMIPVSPFHMNAVSAVLAWYIQKYTVYLLYDLHHSNISPGFLLATLQVCIKSSLEVCLPLCWTECHMSQQGNLPLHHTGCPSHSVCSTGPLVSQTGNSGLRTRTCAAFHLPISRRQPAAVHKQAYWINVKKHSGPRAR